MSRADSALHCMQSCSRQHSDQINVLRCCRQCDEWHSGSELLWNIINWKVSSRFKWTELFLSILIFWKLQYWLEWLSCQSFSVPLVKYVWIIWCHFTCVIPATVKMRRIEIYFVFILTHLVLITLVETSTPHVTLPEGEHSTLKQLIYKQNCVWQV